MEKDGSLPEVYFYITAIQTAFLGRNPFHKTERSDISSLFNIFLIFSNYSLNFREEQIQ